MSWMVDQARGRPLMRGVRLPGRERQRGQHIGQAKCPGVSSCESETFAVVQSSSTLPPPPLPPLARAPSSPPVLGVHFFFRDEMLGPSPSGFLDPPSAMHNVATPADLKFKGDPRLRTEGVRRWPDRGQTCAIFSPTGSLPAPEHEMDGALLANALTASRP